MPSGPSTPSTTAAKPTSGQPTVKVCLLGATGAGKTCFLAGLAVLSEPDRKSIITVLHDNKHTAAYLDSLQDTLRHGQWPPPNNTTLILDMTVIVDGGAIDLRVVDYPGEDFTGALRTLDTSEIEELYQFSRDAQIFLLLFAPHRDLAGADAATLTSTLVDRQRAHLQAITQVWKERGGASQDRKSSHPVELGLVVTQSDRVPGLTSPRAAKMFFDSHAPNLVAKLSGLADSVSFFGISVVAPPADGDGSKVITDNMPPPSRLNPHGYEPLFQWIRDYGPRHRFRRRLPWLVGAAVSAVVVLAVSFTMWKVRADHFQSILTSDAPAIDRIAKTSGFWLDSGTRTLREDLIRETVQRLNDEIEKSATPDEFERLGKEVMNLAAAKPESFNAKISKLQQQLTVRGRHIIFVGLENDFQSHPRPLDFASRAAAFVDRYQSGSEVDAVRGMIREIGKEEIGTHRIRIKGMPTRTALDFSAKDRQIIEFVNKYEKNLEPEEASRMRKAAELARLFSERRNWTVTIKKSGGLTGSYSHLVLLGKTGLGSQELHVFDGTATGSSPDKVWSTSDAVFSWQAGDPITVTLYAKGTVFGGWVAYYTDDSALAIGSLVGRRTLKTRPGYEAYVNTPYVECEVEDLSPSHWEIVRAYLSPGSAW